jgi:hypothetical protein
LRGLERRIQDQGAGAAFSARAHIDAQDIHPERLDFHRARRYGNGKNIAGALFEVTVLGWSGGSKADRTKNE